MASPPQLGLLIYLRARPPRVEYAEHSVRQVRLPWAEPMSRFNALFARLASDVLKESDVEGACRILRLSWDEGWGIAERAVGPGAPASRGRRPGPREDGREAAGRGQDYIAVVLAVQIKEGAFRAPCPSLLGFAPVSAIVAAASN